MRTWGLTEGETWSQRGYREKLERFMRFVEENAKSTRMEKQALAWLIKKNTSVTGKWIAERTGMGHPSTASLAINRFARDNSRAATLIRKKLLGALIVT
jgi:hypothetical protein